MASTRFPGKPLATISGLPMVEHVRRRALLATSVDEVVVATCDAVVADVVRAAGGHAIMTAGTHERCTTRVEEAVRNVPSDIVAIVQGDEPLLDPQDLDRVVEPIVNEPAVASTNVVSPIGRVEDLSDPSIVKCALNQAGNILFFTRAPIPHVRVPGRAPVYRQTGIMAFRAETLREYARLPETPLERIESIDMLRLLEHGRPIRGVIVDHSTMGVDYPAHVGPVEAVLRTDPDQRLLHERILATPTKIQETPHA